MLTGLLKKVISKQISRDFENGSNIFSEIKIMDSIDYLSMYKLRWQIELILKTWKSILKIHKIHSMNAVRLECIILIKLLWVMLNWSILKLLEEKTQQDMSLHKLTHTIISRSKILTRDLLQNRNLFKKWVIEMCEIGVKHHPKEYKKGSLKESEILCQTYFKTT